MYMIIAQSYDVISKYVLGLLNKFSHQIIVINNSIQDLIGNDKFRTNEHFRGFVQEFELGRYYHFQCEGYMESLVVTTCYSPFSIKYWKDALVSPADKHFMEALMHLNQLKKIDEFKDHESFKELMTKIDGFKRISSEIMDAIGLYNL